MAKFLLCFRPITDENESGGSTEQSSSTTENRRTVAYVELLLKRTSEPIGLVLDGGTDQDVPVFVSDLRPGGAAEASAFLQVGDQILAINGTGTERLTNTEVKTLLETAGSVINLEIGFETPPDYSVDENTKKTARISIPRDGDRNSFGFTIRGGVTENRPITVSNVRVDSVPYRNGVLKAGDRIKKINGIDISRYSQMETLSLLKSCGETCLLGIEYDTMLHDDLSEELGPLQVDLLKPKGASLGIQLRPAPPSPHSVGRPLVISRVKEAGIADRCGALHVGDRLLSVNGVPLDDKTVSEVYQMLLLSDLPLKLEIIPAHNFTEEVFDSASHVSTHLTSVPSRLSRRQSQLSLASSAHLLSHPETMFLRVQADSIGLGFSLQGGATEYTNHPLVISSIEEGGPAARLGQLQVGDRILTINGVRMEGVSLQRAVKLVKETPNIINIEVEFDVQDAVVPTSGTFEVEMVKTGSLNLGITINGSHQPGDTIWISKLRKGGVAYRMGMFRPGDVLLAINNASLVNVNLRDAAHLLKTAGDVVTLRVSKDNTPVGVGGGQLEPIIYSVELHRNQRRLGITLKGSGDQPGHPIVIAKIKEDGVAHRTGTMRVGDRILAINGESLYGKTIPEALKMLHNAGDIVSLKISKAMRRHRSRSKATSPVGKAMRFGGRNRSWLNRSHAIYSRMRHESRPRTASSLDSGRTTPENHPLYGGGGGGGVGGGGPQYGLSGGYSRYRYEDIMDPLTPSEAGSAFSRPSSSVSGIPKSPYTFEPVRSDSTTPVPYPTDTSMFPDSLEGQPHGSRKDLSLKADEEVRAYSHRPISKPRRPSLPLQPSRHTSAFNQYKRWDFTRRPSYQQKIPVGYVTPISTTMIDSESEPTYPKQLDSPKPKLEIKEPASSKSLASKHEELESSIKSDRFERDRKLSLTEQEASAVTTPHKVDSFSPPRQGKHHSNSETAVAEVQSEACLKKFEETIDKADKFKKEFDALAEAGSSDQDSDSEPHRLKSGSVPPHLQEKIQEKMSTTAPLLQVSVSIRKKPMDTTFGFSIAEGEYDPGFYVKKVKEGGPADCRLNGGLLPYDKILKINDTVIKPDFSFLYILSLLKEGGNTLSVLVARHRNSPHNSRSSTLKRKSPRSSQCISPQTSQTSLRANHSSPRTSQASLRGGHSSPQVSLPSGHSSPQASLRSSPQASLRLSPQASLRPGYSSPQASSQAGHSSPQITDANLCAFQTSPQTSQTELKADRSSPITTRVGRSSSQVVENGLDESQLGLQEEAESAK